MTEIYLHFIFAHYGLYGNAQKEINQLPKDRELRSDGMAPLTQLAISVRAVLVHQIDHQAPNFRLCIDSALMQLVCRVSAYSFQLLAVADRAFLVLPKLQHYNNKVCTTEICLHI